MVAHCDAGVLAAGQGDLAVGRMLGPSKKKAPVWEEGSPLLMATALGLGIGFLLALACFMHNLKIQTLKQQLNVQVLDQASLEEYSCLSHYSNCLCVLPIAKIVRYLLSCIQHCQNSYLLAKTVIAELQACLSLKTRACT